MLRATRRRASSPAAWPFGVVDGFEVVEVDEGDGEPGAGAREFGREFEFEAAAVEDAEKRVLLGFSFEERTDFAAEHEHQQGADEGDEESADDDGRSDEVAVLRHHVCRGA